MGDRTGIEWTDATVNFWWGCTKVSPGCDHCYAETLAERFYPGHWGIGAPRRLIPSASKTLLKLERHSPQFMRANGRRRRVFIQSMSDYFDNEVPDSWRTSSWELMAGTTSMDIQLLTKRIGNVGKMVPGEWPQHLGLMISVCTQEEANRDIPKLMVTRDMLRIPWIGLSVEPLLGPIDLVGACQGGPGLGVDWVIVGAESGPGARQMNDRWALDVVGQCREGEVPVFVKQLSGLGGRPVKDMALFPPSLQVREYPKHD